MKDLSNSIYAYYLAHRSELSADHAFHFASRLYQWDQDDGARQLLDELKDDFTCQGSSEAAVQLMLEKAKTDPYKNVTNALERRLPFFEKYPLLRACNLVLFRLTFLQTIYNIDARELFFRYFSREEVEAMRRELLTDATAIATLATYATNFLYLYDRVILEDEDSLPVQWFYEVGATAYDLTQSSDLQLYIYLYTHCIIGESVFYYRGLPDKNLARYQSMIADLENVIDEHFSAINLDSKFEFLVAAQLCGVTSKLSERIADEARQSVSVDGTYLVDTMNSFPQSQKVSLEASEHRNVLFIMSQRAFTPLG
jgi:hypothetical protein